MTSDEVRSMKYNEFPDMDYFFHKFDDTDNDDFGEEGAVSYKKSTEQVEYPFCTLYIFYIICSKTILYLHFISP